MDESISFAPFILDALSRRLNKPIPNGAVYSVSLGDYEDPLGWIPQARARKLFWDAFQVEAPDVLDRLFESDSARIAVREQRPGRWTLPQLEWFGRENRLWDTHFSKEPAMRHLYLDAMSALVDWMTTIGEAPSSVAGNETPARILAEPHPICHAYRHFSLSPLLGSPYGDRSMYFELDDWLDVDILDDHGEPVMGWNPVFETRTDAKARHMAFLERQLDEGLDKREQQARARGLIKVAAKKRTTEHFRWLVRYHCLEQTYEMIARSVGKSRPAVTEGVTAAAGLLGINLRDPIRRPRRRKRNARTVAVNRMNRT